MSGWGMPPPPPPGQWVMPPAPPGPAPNWYPDPSGVGELRYWNGWAWTAGVVIRGHVTERPLPDPRFAPALNQRDERVDLPPRAFGLGVAGFVAGVVLGVVLSLTAEAADAPRLVAFLLGQAGLWTALLGSCWWASQRYGTGHLLRDYGLTLAPTDVSWGLLMSVVARVAGVLLLVPIILAAPDLLEDNVDGYRRVAENDVAVAIALAVVATLGAPVVEELFFRGLIQGSLSTALGSAGAISLQAVLFGLAHYNPLLGKGNIIVLTVVTAAGVVFGIAARWRGLGTSVMAHLFFNMLAMVLVLG